MSTSSEKIEDTTEAKEDLSPLYLFLASSLNVELVFIILTSISQFCRVSVDQDGHNQLEVSDDINAYLVEENDKCMLNIDEIEIGVLY